MPKVCQILTMQVDNEFGVLTRITSLIRREGLNIKGLSVAETVSPSLSRLTVNVEMQGIALSHILDRLSRLDCVRRVSVYREDTTVKRELALVLCLRTSTLWQGRPIVWENESAVCFELTGTPEEVDGFLAGAADQGVIDVARGGAVTIEKGGDPHDCDC